MGSPSLSCPSLRYCSLYILILSFCQERPYHNDSTASRLLSEVKHCRARLVLRWGTTLESLVLFFCCFDPLPNNCFCSASWSSAARAQLLSTHNNQLNSLPYSAKMHSEPILIYPFLIFVSMCLLNPKIFPFKCTTWKVWLRGVYCLNLSS